MVELVMGVEREEEDQREEVGCLEVEEDWAEAETETVEWEVVANPWGEEMVTGFRTCMLHVPMPRM